MSILFLGVGYFPYLTTGEKNYYFKLLPLLKRETDVVLLSLNDHYERIMKQETASGEIQIYCVRRPFHRNYERFFFRGNGITSYHHRHSPPLEISEKFLSIFVNLPRIRHIISKHAIRGVHFMDNFGPAMPFLKRMFPKLKVTYTAANYDPRGSISVYDSYLRLCIGFLDGVSVNTKAYMKKLQEIGIRIPMRLTRWGVTTIEEELEDERRLEIRRKLDVQDNHRFILWSGYLQQIRERDFYKTIDIARIVSKIQGNVTFVFVFKPETFRKKYCREARDHVRVIQNIRNFREVLCAADFFLSPIGNVNSTVSPPLTWLEAMSMGTPVITTRVGGVDEIITHNQSGYVATSYDDLAEVVIQAIEYKSLQLYSENIRKVIREEYDIRQSAKVFMLFLQEIVG